MTVRELLTRIDSRELTEWAAFFGLEPWGTEVEDWRAGMVASIIANTNRDPKKQKKPFQPRDFMPRREPARAQDAGEIEDTLSMWTGVWKQKFDDGGVSE
jgi:hypothetical protein